MSTFSSLFSLGTPSAQLDPMLAPSSSLMPFMGAVDSGVRTSTAAMPTDTRKEITNYTRTQLVRKSRWLYNNMGLIKRFVNGATRYSVGLGIVPIPLTKNKEFNQQVETYFCDWADSKELCDVRRKMSFWRMQKHVLRSMFKDGEAFTLKAPSPDELLPNGVDKILGRPRVQWLESQVVGNTPAFGDRDQDGYREGVLADDFGAAKRYRLLYDSSKDRYDLSQSRTVPHSSVLHLYDVERASQIRGLPWLYHGVNCALDVLDLTALEKHATKLHAAMAAAIKKRSADAGRGGFTGDLTKVKGANAQGKTRTIAFENFLGGAGILQLALDEEFQLFTSNRTSQTFTGFLDYLIRDIAWGFGLSPEFIWSCAGLGGPNFRGVLEDAKWFFEDIQDLMVELFCRPIYMWVLARGIERGEIVVPADVEDPYLCAWQGPSKITIDQGHEGDLELEQLKNGCGTWEQFWAKRGKNGRKMVEGRIDELAAAMEYAAGKKGPGHEDGVPFDYVIALDKGGNGDAEDPAAEKKKKKLAKKPA